MPDSGILYYIMGPSGAGKDTLLREVRRRNPDGVVFSHRYITRSRNAGREAHVPLAFEEFRMRRDHGLFALDWEAHNTMYGLGLEIDCWLEKGLSVVANGSRGALDRALERYPGLLAVYIQVQPAILRERLLKRGRETPEQIEYRLTRNHLYPPQHPGARIIDNSGSLQHSVEALLRLFS